jgi:hypothetical protein
MPWFKRHDSEDPWAGRQPRYERLESDGAGGFFLVARLPSGELARRELGLGSFEFGPAAPPRRWLEKLHNPHDYHCMCGAECWCRRSWLGHAVRWYVPSRWHRVRPPRQQ